MDWMVSHSMNRRLIPNVCGISVCYVCIPTSRGDNYVEGGHSQQIANTSILKHASFGKSLYSVCVSVNFRIEASCYDVFDTEFWNQLAFPSEYLADLCYSDIHHVYLCDETRGST